MAMNIHSGWIVTLSKSPQQHAEELAERLGFPAELVARWRAEAGE